MSEQTRSEHELSRRAFLEGTGVALVVASTATADLEAQRSGTPAPAIAVEPTVPRTTVRLTVNGTSQRVEVEDRWTLAELLRDRLGLTGTKIGCDRGECGACTVLVDDRPVYACSQLAVWMEGRTVTTVEGLARNGVLTPLQQAFADHDAPQCGFCTPGQLMTATALLRSNPRPSADEVKHALAGNLCRCASYNHYVDAVLAASTASARSSSAGGGQ
jgi:xanthine dehydrogenase YagT iron-sulfur-binding subunit